MRQPQARRELQRPDLQRGLLSLAGRPVSHLARQRLAPNLVHPVHPDRVRHSDHPVHAHHSGRVRRGVHPAPEHRLVRATLLLLAHSELLQAPRLVPERLESRRELA